MDEQYIRRFNPNRPSRHHKSFTIVQSLRPHFSLLPIPANHRPVPLVMPTHYSEGVNPDTWDTVTAAYREYYLNEKLKFARWKHGSVPELFRDEYNRIHGVGEEA